MTTKIRKKGRYRSYTGLLLYKRREGIHKVIRYKSNNAKPPYKGLNPFKYGKDFLAPIPTLNDKYKWKEECINFVKSCLVKDPKYLKILNFLSSKKINYYLWRFCKIYVKLFKKDFHNIFKKKSEYNKIKK